jgi:hypothetical protein
MELKGINLIHLPSCSFFLGKGTLMLHIVEGLAPVPGWPLSTTSVPEEK